MKQDHETGGWEPLAAAGAPSPGEGTSRASGAGASQMILASLLSSCLFNIGFLLYGYLLLFSSLNSSDIMCCYVTVFVMKFDAFMCFIE